MQQSLLRRAAQPVRAAVRGKATAVEATAPEAALQPKVKHTAGDDKLMKAEYTEEIGYLFGEKVGNARPPLPPGWGRGLARVRREQQPDGGEAEGARQKRHTERRDAGADRKGEVDECETAGRKATRQRVGQASRTGQPRRRPGRADAPASLSRCRAGGNPAEQGPTHWLAANSPD